MPGPVNCVLAGVNGASRSSVGGRLLTRAATGGNVAQANGAAWRGSMRRLDAALTGGTSYAFETPLGGRSVPARLAQAARTHDALLWFCGLATPEAKLRERWHAATAHLVALLPHLAKARLFDNSASVAPVEPVPDPLPVAHVRHGELVWPAADDLAQLRRTPGWAKPVLATALR